MRMSMTLLIAARTRVPLSRQRAVRLNDKLGLGLQGASCAGDDPASGVACAVSCCC